ncbi:hypothetical protein PIB30_074630 [Stylosanthes scabra]|uniref:Uncharacterized protein n=1 Tax=Stylosanthes scabra TaxID=79078 RepID=A0ABU6TQJ4_9FABA|nr:hypothetical protein [Stylosanthes scabra]
MGWGFSLRIFIRHFRYRFKLGKLAKYPWNSECLAFSEVQVFRCMSRRTRGRFKIIRHVRDLVYRFWGVTPTVQGAQASHGGSRTRHNSNIARARQR